MGVTHVYTQGQVLNASLNQTSEQMKFNLCLFLVINFPMLAVEETVLTEHLLCKPTHHEGTFLHPPL